MIRRDVLQLESDQRAVRWCLILSILALSVGCLAEVVRERQAVAQQIVPVDTTAATTNLVTYAEP